MSFSFLVDTDFLQSLRYIEWICVLLIFSSFCVKDVYFKCHLRYVFPIVIILLFGFSDHFVRLDGGMVSISGFHKNNFRFFDNNVGFFISGVKLFFVIYFVISFFLFYFFKSLALFARRIKARFANNSL